MAITDNLVYRLKPKSGDASPYNEIGGPGTNVLSGGTIALVDRGSGDFAWQFSGGVDNVATAPSFSFTPSAANSDITIAVTLKVITSPATGNFTRFASYENSADTNAFVLLSQNNNANTLRCRSQSSGGADAVIPGTPGATETTYVMRLRSNGATAEVLEVWIKGAGAAGRAPDVVSASMGMNGTTFDKIQTRTTATSVHQIKDWCIWHRALTDTEAAAVADNLRGTVDAATTTPVNADTTASYTVFSAVSADLVASYVLQSATAVSADTVATYNVIAPVSADLVASYGVLNPVTKDLVASYTVASAGLYTSNPLTANNLLLWAPGTSVSWTWTQGGRAGSMTGKAITEGTGTLNSLSKLSLSALPAGAGELKIAILGGSPSADAVYIEYGTVS